MAILDQVTTLQNYTAYNESQKENTTRSTELGQDAFLKLLLTELENQNPLEPMGNTEFISQQAQFTQINELQKLNDSFSSQTTQMQLLNTSTALNNQVMQASNLVGKEVTVVNPENTEETITGTVTAANFTDGNATVTINGKDYALGYVTKIAQPATTASITE